MPAKAHLEIHEVNRTEASEKRRWLDRMLKNPTAMLILGLAIASGVWRILVPSFLPSFSGPGTGDGGRPVAPIETPMACARAMQEMREALVTLKFSVDAQDKRLDRMDAKLDRINDRIDDRLAFGRSTTTSRPR